MSLPARLWQYLGERFPPLRNGLLIAAFAAAAVGIGALATPAPTMTPATLGAVFAALFALFLQLRIADEHKDYATDLAHRPERAVPRGLVTLRELDGLGLVAGALALGVTLAQLPRHTLAVLLAVWLWMALMRREFFVADWLAARPIPYLVSHMLIMPLLAVYGVAAALPTLAVRHGPAIAAFLGLAFAQGVVLEVARKCWAPEAERDGVDTYSSHWGPTAAGATVAAAMLASAACGSLIVWWLDLPPACLAAIVATALAGMGGALHYALAPGPGTADRLEIAGGLLVLINYLAVAPLPLAVSSWSP